MKHLGIVCATALVLSAPALAMPGETEDSVIECETVTPVLETLAERLDQDFYLPTQGAAYARYLRSIDLQHTDPAEISAEVTRGLQQVFPDGHLSLEHSSQKDAKAGGDQRDRGRPALPPAIEGWSMLDDETAYIALTHFVPDDQELAELKGAIRTFSGAKVLIVDLRKTMGGSTTFIDHFTEQLFDSPVDLLWMETRRSVDQRGDSPIVDGPTIRRVDAPDEIVRRVHHVVPAEEPTMANTALYILTSERTASAGEHFAYAMQRSGRGVVIGETTRGAGRFGRYVELPCGYGAFIPMGQTYDPDNGFSWEGVGVTPDHSVPAEEALSVALKDAGYSEARRARLLTSPAPKG